MLSFYGSEVSNKGKVESILLTVSDVTDLISAAERQVAQNEAIISIVSNYDSFLYFLDDFKGMKPKMKEAMDQKDRSSSLAMLHTLKGNFRTFHLDFLSERVHDLEEKEDLTFYDFVSLYDELNRFLKNHEAVIGIDPSKQDQNRILLSNEELSSLKELVSSEKEELKEFISSLSKPTIKSMLGPVHEALSRIAMTQNKEVEFQIHGQDLRINPKFQPIFLSLVHLINNAVDHGFDEKSRNGKIDLDFSFDAHELTIVAKDNGKGLQKSKILEKAKDLGLVQEGQDLGDQEIAALIFEDEFSTKDEVSAISGRGAGLNALKRIVQNYQGLIEVDVTHQPGTKIVIHVPLEEESPAPVSTAV